MNPSLLGALAVTLVAALWLAGRRRSSTPPERDIRAVVALNRAQIALVRKEAATATAAPGMERRTAPAASSETIDPLPLPRFMDGRERQALLARIGALGRGDAAARLQAMAIARRWGHPAALPLLRRGLRDPDPAVMREAALAIETFRGRPFAAAPPLPGRSAQPLSRPRNVVRIR